MITLPHLCRLLSALALSAALGGCASVSLPDWSLPTLGGSNGSSASGASGAAGISGDASAADPAASAAGPSATRPRQPTAAEIQAQQEAAAEAARQAARPVAICRPDPGSPFAYRKTLWVADAEEPSLRQSAGLRGFGIAWTNGLKAMLAASERFLVVESYSATAPLELSPASSQALGSRVGAQFILATRVSSIDVQDQTLLSLAGVRVPGFQRVYRVRLEYALYDAAQGFLLARFGDDLSVTAPRSESARVGAVGFQDTVWGQELARVLAHQVEAIEDELACLPLQTPVLSVSDGTLRFAAGFLNGISPGDTMRVYVRQRQSGGWVETASAPITISEVFANVSHARVPTALSGTQWLHESWVRAW